MPNRGQNQDQQQNQRRNPTTTSPDDDEAQVEDESHLAGQDQTQGGRKRRPGDPLTDLGSEEVQDGDLDEDDDDEKEGISR